MFSWAIIISIVFPFTSTLQVQDVEELRLGSGFTDVTDFSALPWRAVFMNRATNAFVGNGVIVNQFWLITSTTIANTLMANVYNFDCYEGVSDITQLSAAGVVRHNIRAAFKHPLYDGANYITDLATVRVCPQFVTTSYVTLPAVQVPVNAGTSVNLYTFTTGPMKIGVNSIAANNECFNSFTSFNLLYSFCLTASSTVTLDTADVSKNVLVMEGNNLRGFVITTGTSNAVKVMKMDVWENWIKIHTPIDYTNFVPPTYGPDGRL